MVTQADDERLSLRHLGPIAYAAAGSLCDGYAFTTFASSMAFLFPVLGLTPEQLGLLSLATLVGTLAGALGSGLVADRGGRSGPSVARLVLIAFGVLAQAFAQNATEFALSRFVIGIAIGANLPVLGALVAESVPAPIRGTAITAMQAAFFLGVLGAQLVALGLTAAHAGESAGRLFLASPVAFAGIALILRVVAPESPRWIAAKTRPVAAGSGGMFGFVCVTWFVLGLSFALVSVAPAILIRGGFPLERAGYVGISVSGALFAGSLVTMVLIDVWGRRPLTIAAFAIGALAFGSLALLGENPGVTVASLLAAAVAFGAAATMHTYATEAPTTRWRAIGIGLASGAGRIGTGIGAVMAPMLAIRDGTHVAAIGEVVLCILGLAISLAFARETKGTKLPTP